MIKTIEKKNNTQRGNLDWTVKSADEFLRKLLVFHLFGLKKKKTVY